jgi:hypothetical protein
LSEAQKTEVVAKSKTKDGFKHFEENLTDIRKNGMKEPRRSIVKDYGLGPTGPTVTLDGEEVSKTTKELRKSMSESFESASEAVTEKVTATKQAAAKTAKTVAAHGKAASPLVGVAALSGAAAGGLAAGAADACSYVNDLGDRGYQYTVGDLDIMDRSPSSKSSSPSSTKSLSTQGDVFD